MRSWLEHTEQQCVWTLNLKQTNKPHHTWTTSVQDIYISASYPQCLTFISCISEAAWWSRDVNSKPPLPSRSILPYKFLKHGKHAVVTIIRRTFKEFSKRHNQNRDASSLFSKNTCVDIQLSTAKQTKAQPRWKPGFDQTLCKQLLISLENQFGESWQPCAGSS